MSTRFTEMVHICTQDDPEVFRSVLDRIADKWTLIVIALLEERTLRFTELLASIPGISRRMLTLTLRSLERDGLVTRKIYAEVPPRVEYRATELGVALSAPVVELATWIARHKKQIQGHRLAFDAAVEGRSSEQ